jgi:hypothetical protein
MEYDVGSNNEKSVEPIRVYNNINTQNIIINMGSNGSHCRKQESFTSLCNVGTLEENTAS